MKKVVAISLVLAFLGCKKDKVPVKGYPTRDGITDLEQRFARMGTSLFASNHDEFIVFQIGPSGILDANTSTQEAVFNEHILGMQATTNRMYYQLRRGSVYGYQPDYDYVVGHADNKGNFAASDSVVAVLSRSNSDGTNPTFYEVIAASNSTGFPWQETLYEGSTTAKALVALDNQHLLFLNEVSAVYELVNGVPVKTQELLTPNITHLRKAGNYWFSSAGPVVEIFEWNGSSLVKIGAL